ncbi:glycoside hydrolase family 3 N-terminal domain-containing protein [Butyrivibrio sp. MC2021]|uniref:glycoside hydrolase family 3 N-terminal domain-containing protein n=1 Tax=Butyrivibrio sp. MC2021 TaxID=1408306 RepID=UPI000687B467|nr:glycoside hydrolase family 3 N-terminal domain-containing protein [Butyrivibrio sp. MC2021]
MGKFEDQDMDEKRLLRHQRRKRSQLIAFITVAVVLLLLIAGVAFCVHYIKGAFAQRKAREVAEAAAAAEESSQEIVIETPEETPEVQEMSDEEVLREIVDSCIAEMPIEDKVAGLFIVTPEQITGVETAVKAGSGTQDALAKYAVGGINYVGKNIKSEDQITEMLSTTASMSKYPIFTMVAEEGNIQSSITSSIDTIGAEEITDVASAEQAGSKIGAAMYKYGFNLNLAPYVDLTEDNHFGADPQEAANRMTSFAIGLKSQGVNCCAYYFPVAASYEGAADLTREDLEAGAYIPFRNAIEGDDLTAVLVGNAVIPAIATDSAPASLSQDMITGELRGNLGYKGIVIAGPLNESVVTDNYNPERIAVEAINAGADMLYLCGDFEAAYNGLLEAVKSGEISEGRIDESLRRIYSIKYADRVNEITNQ